MTKKELRILSLKFRTLSSQMLKIDNEEEIRYIKIFMDFINESELISKYISHCHSTDYDIKKIIESREYGERFKLPDNTADIVDYCYQLLTYILKNNLDLIRITIGYSNSRKFANSITAFMRKTIEPFVVAIKEFIEIKLIEIDDITVTDVQTDKSTAFLSYCQKDSKIADIIDNNISKIISADRLTITRDVRDVEYHQSFKRFMDSIEDHDYVIMLISDRYLKSRNCLYEVLETIKDNKFGNRLAFIVLSDDDSVWLDNATEDKIGADVYSIQGQANYIMYWQNEESNIKNQINAINDPAASIGLSKELKHIKKIELDLQDLMDYIREYKGLPLKEHIDTEFEQMLKFMKLK